MTFSPVLGDRVQLQQVVLDLVMNAIEAMRSVVERARELVITTWNIAQSEMRVFRPGTLEEPKLRRSVFHSRILGQRCREKSVNQGRRNGQARYFGILRSKQFTIRMLLDQFPQQLSREGSLIFTARRKRK